MINSSTNSSPLPRLTVVTLGVRDFHASVRFYQALGFERRLRVSGDEIAFFDAGGVVLALCDWDKLAQDAAATSTFPRGRRRSEAPAGFRGTALTWLCASRAEVDAAFLRALTAEATLLQAAQESSGGDYSGYFADPDGHPWEIGYGRGLSLSPEGRLLLAD
jgi:catechol 2,3-dioxygenase-like lactoylglutathione lyase family enzyme